MESFAEQHKMKKGTGRNMLTRTRDNIELMAYADAEVAACCVALKSILFETGKNRRLVYVFFIGIIPLASFWRSLIVFTWLHVTAPQLVRHGV